MSLTNEVPPPQKKKQNKNKTITTKLAYFIQLKLTNLMSQSLSSWNGGQVQTDSMGRLGTPSGLYASPCAHEYFGLWVLHHNNHIYMLSWPFSPWAFYPHSRHPVLHHFHSVVGSGVSWSNWQLVHRLTLDFLRDQLKKIAHPLHPAIHQQTPRIISKLVI